MGKWAAEVSLDFIRIGKILELSLTPKGEEFSSKLGQDFGHSRKQQEHTKCEMVTSGNLMEQLRRLGYEELCIHC